MGANTVVGLAERKFKRYWRIIKPMGAFVSRELLQAVRTKAQRSMAERAYQA